MLRSANGYLTDPWTIPVPVRKSHFTPLNGADERFNVETAPIPTFGFAVRSSSRSSSRFWADDQLLHTDLQTNADVNTSHQRLGSGRSGFLSGRYLKGIGRTPLAGNWNDARDLYHNSGHLLPTAAAREYLISRVFVARGLAHTINPCAGILVGKAPAAGLLRRIFSRRLATKIGACDLALAAVTTKDSGFARMSNFVWALNHGHASAEFVGDLLARFCGYLQTPAQHLEDCNPSGIAHLLDQAIARAQSHFQTYVRIGVHWGSVHNNVTLDGRFLDLELPVFLGRPFLGVLSVKDTDRFTHDARRGEEVVGLEIQDYFTQARAFVRFLSGRLRTLLLDRRSLPRVLRDFLDQLVRALARTFHRSHVIYSGPAQDAAVVAMLDEVFAFSSQQRAWVSRLVRVRRIGLAGRLAGPTLLSRVSRLPVKLANPEPALTQHAYAFDAAGAADAPLAEDALAFNQSLDRVEGIGDSDGFLAAIAIAERELLPLARPEPRAGTGVARISPN